MHHSKHQAGDEPNYRDPVCGMEISRKTAVDEYEYQGKMYYFCAQACRQSFEVEPEKYILHHRQHGVKPR